MKNVVTKIIIVILIVLYPVSNIADIIKSEHTAVSAAQVQQVDLSAVSALDEQSVADIEKKIDKLSKKKDKKQKQNELKKQRENSINALLKQIDSGKTSYRQIMKGTVIAGDSLMHGLNEYDVLDRTYLITKVSANLSHLEKNMDTIVGLNPKVLVLHYGLNNISTNDTEIKNFVSKYERLVKELKDKLPDTKIVVSSVFNVSSSVAKGRFSDIAKFNSSLKDMCKRNGLIYLDNSGLISGNSDYYEPDGIHVVKKFYTEKYLPNLIIALGL